MLNNLYLVCLLVGVLYSLVSVVANGLLDSLDMDFDFDILSLPLKPFTVMSFITVFGGVGLIALGFMPPLFSLIPAVFLAYFVSFALYNLVYIRLKSYETEASHEMDALMKEAEIVEKILPGGYGKISYVLDGNILSAVAREREAGNGIAKGAKVYIMAIENNVYYVSETCLEESESKEEKESRVN